MDAIERLTAIEDIRRLKARYFRCVDGKDWDGLAAVFAPDAVFDHSRGGSLRDPWTGLWGPPLPAEPTLSVGRDAIMARIRSVVELIHTAHQGFMPEIEIVDAHRATGIWAMSDQLYDRAGRLILSGTGHYHESYEKLAGGWAIKTTALTRLRLIRGDGERP